MSSRRAENFTNLENAEVTVIAARNPDTGADLASRVSSQLTDRWEDLVAREDVDAIVVGTHNELHGPISIAALEAGKHIFCEYPTTRLPNENRRLAQLLSQDSSPVFRLSNNESVSAEHKALKKEVGRLGDLFTSHFLRLTPGRGKRPDVLFNLNLTGPPALFFVYHVHTYVSLFGAAEWVHATGHYEGLQENTGYDRFVNTVTVGFVGGGTGQWAWAGGIEIDSATQEARIVLQEGTLIETETGWDTSTSQGTHPLEFGDNLRSLEAQFVADIQEETDWKSEAEVGIQAAAIGHAAEASIAESRVVRISEVI